ncbi:hypothetical protein [Mucilaginibacter flavus]|uniref:hypothetical protein n=1 Tax=Mucilaginibacter flavus TaxID=931504 RepID=UPI0025B5EDB7|nr:hypothetical protein [Mucilaginibacter flavus]MDN3579241.1 hypothetical protein [Mucilaginibacter flavus]
MVTQIGPPKGILVLRIVILIALVLAALYYAYGLINHSGHYLGRNRATAWVAPCGFMFIGVSLFLNLFFTPSAVLIDDELKTLEVKYLMRSSKNLGFFGMQAYSTTTIKQKNGASYGIFIYLTNGKKILLTDRDFKDYNLVEEFLINLKVKALGEEDYSIVGYLRNQLMG